MSDNIRISDVDQRLSSISKNRHKQTITYHRSRLKSTHATILAYHCPRTQRGDGLSDELEEALISGSAADIIPLLAVPHDTHRHASLEADPGKNIDDEEEKGCTKRPRLNRPLKSHRGKAARITYHDSKDIRGPDREIKPKSLYALSSKVHNLIFGSLGGIEDVLSLSLVNRYFWAVGVTHIEDRIVSSLAPWAGEGIICISDDSDPSDFPPGLLSAKEQADLAHLIRVHHIDTFTIDNIWKKTGSRSLSQRLEDRFKELEADKPVPEADRTDIMICLKPDILNFYPRDQPWILRNLTTKEYVRGEVIALRESFIHGPQINILGFSEVLISRISWSSRPINVEHGGNLSHGKWAGHQFNIVPLTCVQKSVSQDWTDASNEILREMDLIFTNQKGDDWRDKLSQRKQNLAPSVALAYS